MTKGRDARRSRDEVEALIGKRTPLPGGNEQLSPQFIARRLQEAKAARRVAEDDRPGIDPQIAVDPRRTNQMRMQRAGVGMAKGGKVQRRPLGDDETRLVGFDEMTPTEKTTWYAERASEARELDNKAKETENTQRINNAIYGAKKLQAGIGLLPEKFVGDKSTVSDDYKRKADAKRREEPKPNVKYGMDTPRKLKYAAGGAVRGNGCASKGKTRGTMR